MKRSWMGFGLLVGLLVSAVLASSAMVRIYQSDSEKLEQAALEALQENWEGAARLTAQARSSWEKSELFRCAMGDHTPAEEIDALFSVLEVYGSSRERVAFAAVCRETAKKLEALGDAHRLNLRNLL